MRARFTSAADGDLGVDAPDVSTHRRAVVDAPWSWRRQVHGADVAVVTAPGEHAGSTGDAAVTDLAGPVLSAQGADCAPVLFWSPEGVVGAAHAGWRGLVVGVVQHTVAEMRALGATHVRALLGPCIHPEDYEFGEDDLAQVVDALGPGVAATTRHGTTALDVPAAVRAAVSAAGARLDHDVDANTADARWFSHRTRGDRGRHAGVIWSEAPR